MPASTQARVRPSVSSLQEQVEHLHFNDTPARCKSPCCAPLTPPEPSPIPERPLLSRNVASHHTATSDKSAYSTGTDGSFAQSDDVDLNDHPEVIDMGVFEQVGWRILYEVAGEVELTREDPRNGR